VSAIRTFVKIAEVGEVVAIACTPDGSIVAVNDREGRVWFWGIDPQVVPSTQQAELLPLRLTPADARGVLLHPDGRVLSYDCDEQELVVRAHDPHSGSCQRSMAFGPIDIEAELDFEERESPSVADGFHFDVAILNRPPPLDWLLPLEIANSRRDAPVDWMSGLPEQLRYQDMYPTRFTRLALHPNQRWLAVLDRSTWIIDVTTGECVNTFGYGIHPAELFEYGEGTHTIGFDDRGLLSVASVAISGNPFLQVDRLDVESGTHETSIENWRQCWGDPDAAQVEVHIYDPTTHLPPERIPAGTHKVLFRRRAIEVWSNVGLVRGVPIDARTCVIPIFDPGSYPANPHALLVTDERLEMLELLTGERSLRRPPIGDPFHTSKITRIHFDEPRRRLLLWREQTALLAATIGEDRWSICELPDGRRMSEWAFAHESGRAFVVDDVGDLWFGEVDPEPGPTPRLTTSLAALQRDLVAKPHDPAPFLIYADALSERGHPRGELIMLHHQGATTQAEALLRTHDLELTGGLGSLAPEAVTLIWERGFVRTASVRLDNAGQLDVVLAFLATDSARLLESLELRMGRRSDVDDVPAVYARLDAYLVAANHLPCLLELSLGAPGEHSLSAALRSRGL
jgi:uncharacterized protein (TIGR02996 family)